MRKAEERVANKESRRKLKEERVAGIIERKAQRQIKHAEKKRMQALLENCDRNNINSTYFCCIK